MRNEPARHQKADSKDNSADGKPIFLAPPEGEQETDTQYDGGDFAGHDVEAAESEQHTNYGGAQVAGREGDSLDASAHVGHAAFVGVQGDGFDAAAGAAGCDGVGEFVEGDDEHLHGPSVYR